MNFKTSENGPIVIVKIDTEGLQNLGFRFKEIKSTFFDLVRIHNFDEKRKKQSYNIIASLRQINNFQKSKSLSSDIIKMTQIARNNNTTAVIAQAALTFKCSTCNDECFSSYGILRHQDSVDHKLRVKQTAESFTKTIDQIESLSFMMINYAYPDLTSISHGVLFKCECSFVGMTALDILFHQHFNCPKTTCSPWSVIEGQFEAKKKPILIIKAKSQLTIEPEQQELHEKPFQTWVNDNKLIPTQETVKFIPQETLIITPIVVMKQSQLECEERIHAIRQKCSITPEECVHDLTFERILDLIKKLDPKKPIEAINSLLTSCRLQSTVVNSSNYDREKGIYIPPSVQPPSVQPNAQNRPSNPTYSEVVETINATPQQRETNESDSPPEIKQKIKMFTGAFQGKIHDLIQESKFSKALQAIETNLNKESLGQTRTDLKQIEEIRKQQLAKLFPTPRKVELKAVFRPFKHAYFKIKESEVVDAIKELDASKSCGASGLSNKIIKKLVNNGRFIQILASAFETLINDPKQMSQILPLFEFRVTLVPKDDGSSRPLAINETMINVLQKIMLKRKDMLSHNFCDEVHTMHADAMLSCKIAGKTLSNRNIILSVDLASAYNNLTTEAIINGMELQGVPQQIQLFVIGMIQAQNCIETHSHSILQGAPLSTILYSYSANPAILELKQRFACVNFADDTIVELKPLDTEKMALEFIDKLFGKYGMQVNTRKCKSTANGAIVTFMGTKYSQNRHDTRTHISSDILIVATKYQQIIKQMLERGLPRSNVMGLFLKCVCTKCSWAIRIDDYNDFTINDYNKVDEILARTFYNIAQPKAISQEDLDGPRSKETIQSLLALMAASIKNLNGFGLILPGLSFQTAQKLLASNKIDPRFKKLQHSIKSENEKMEHAALSTNQDCFVTHTLAYDFDYDNIEFRRAIDILFDTVSVNIPSRECSICHTVHEDSNHSIYCQNFSGLSIQRHNRTQYDLIAALPVKHQPKLSPTYGQFKSSKNKAPDDPKTNKDPGKVLHQMGNADVMIIHNDKPHFFDMSITQRGPTMNREYTQKLETHSTNYEVHTSQIHPIILSDQCTIHPESLKKINQFCRVDKFLRSTARSIIKSHGNRTRIYNEAVKQHAEELQLQFTYADNHDIFYEEFQNRDSDNVVISHDL
ncbi:Reverse_transcriptase/endonuclease [Hexamita inflata]|uniref:Putative n=1 Tax=Hexamita inflata TaxID=28002 RepID=A0AA86PUJ3_9EUKA|nr:Reverse transcriptase/endonuclease [Hexamita inflata]